MTALTVEQHRQLAKDFFNGVWRLLERAERSPGEDRHLGLAREAGARIAEADDREHFLAEMASIGEDGA